MDGGRLEDQGRVLAAMPFQVTTASWSTDELASSGSATPLRLAACRERDLPRGQAAGYSGVAVAMDFEAMIRLFIAPLGTKEQLVATLRQVRDDAQEMLRFGGAVKQEFLDGRAERTLSEIQGWQDLSPDGKNDRGLEIFAQLPVAAPSEHTDRTPVSPRTQRRQRSSGSGSTP